MPGTPASNRLVSGEWRNSVANPFPRANAEKVRIWDEGPCRGFCPNQTLSGSWLTRVPTPHAANSR